MEQLLSTFIHCKILILMYTENHTKGQRSAFVARASPAQVSARMHAMDVDYVEEVEASVVRSRRITVPRTPENTALLSRWPVEKHLSQLLRTFSAFI